MVFSSIRARTLFGLFILSIIGTILLIGLLWPEWFDSQEMPIPDSMIGLVMYVLLATFLTLAIHQKGLIANFHLGSYPERLKIFQYALMAVPLIGLSLFGLYVLYIPLSFVSPEFVSEWALTDSKLLWPPTSLENILANFCNVLTVVILAPILEEIFFRGFLLNRWAHKYSPVKASIFSSVIFALLHTDIIGGFIFGMVLAKLHFRTRSLYGPIIAHMTNNFLALVIVIVELSISKSPDAISIEQLQSEWWIGLIGAMIGIPWLMLYWRDKRCRQ